ncbi:MAG: anti-sigma factor [Alphaproteobacteria bacterium]|nr:anti-sigma factor [Alphaproteobacteria bacterium]
MSQDPRTRPIAEDELHALIDRRLGGERLAAVNDHLAADAADAARVAAWKAQNAALHALYDPILDEGVPARFRRPARPIAATWLGRAAAALLLLVLGGTGGYALRGLDVRTERTIVLQFAERAAIAHAVYSPEVRHPVEVPGSEEAHLAQWLSRRLGTPVTVPDLQGVGFGLVGGRLLPDAKGPAAQYMYQDAAGRRVTLYLKAETGKAKDQTEFEYLRQERAGVLVWRDGGLGWALAGDIDKADLLRLGHVVYGLTQKGR